MSKKYNYGLMLAPGPIDEAIGDRGTCIFRVSQNWLGKTVFEIAVASMEDLQMAWIEIVCQTKGLPPENGKHYMCSDRIVDRVKDRDWLKVE